MVDTINLVSNSDINTLYYLYDVNEPARFLFFVLTALFAFIWIIFLMTLFDEKIDYKHKATFYLHIFIMFTSGILFIVFLSLTLLFPSKDYIRAIIKDRLAEKCYPDCNYKEVDDHIKFLFNENED